MTATATPNRVDARTIREALKAAGVTVAVRITSGRNTTYVEGLDRDSILGTRDLTDYEVAQLGAALAPLWNDSDTRIRVAFGGGGLRIARAGWTSTAPLEAELAILEVAGVHPGRVAELREDSSHVERVAELAEVLPSPLELTVAGVAFRLSGTPGVLDFTRNGNALPGPDVYRLVRDLLVEVDRRRRPIRRPARVSACTDGSLEQLGRHVTRYESARALEAAGITTEEA